MVQVLGGQFPEETAGRIGLVLAVSHPRLGIGKRHHLFCPGNGHIKKPAFFLQVPGREQPAAGREEVLLHPGHEDIGELQPLGCMYGHQGHFIAGFVFGHVGIGKERDILQIIGQGYARNLGIRHQGGILHDSVLHQRIPVVPVAFVHIGLDTVQQLFHIGEAALPLDGIVPFIKEV